jgi:hypothetical protein
MAIDMKVIIFKENNLMINYKNYTHSNYISLLFWLVLKNEGEWKNGMIIDFNFLI